MNSRKSRFTISSPSCANCARRAAVRAAELDVKNLDQFRSWIGESVARRLAIPGLVLILLFVVQATISGASAIRLVGRLEDSNRQSSASLKLTERLLATTRELSEHARAAVGAPDDAQRTAAIADFNETKAQLGSLVDEIST